MKKLGNDDKQRLISALEGTGLRNLFLINNLRKYRIGREIEVYEAGDVIVMNWMKTSVCIARLGEDYPTEDIITLLRSMEFSGLNGPEEALQPLEGYLSSTFDISYRVMLKADRNTFRRKSPRDEHLRELFAPEDWEALFDLYMRTPEYRDDFDAGEREEWALAKAEEEYPTTGVGLYHGEIMVSGAYLSAATMESAMICGVVTDPEWRGCGFASSAVSELVDIALFENNIKAVALWYSNEISKHIYTKLGFVKECDYAYFMKKDRK